MSSDDTSGDSVDSCSLRVSKSLFLASSTEMILARTDLPTGRAAFVSLLQPLGRAFEGGERERERERERVQSLQSSMVGF